MQVSLHYRSGKYCLPVLFAPTLSVGEHKMPVVFFYYVVREICVDGSHHNPPRYGTACRAEPTGSVHVDPHSDMI